MFLNTFFTESNRWLRVSLWLVLLLIIVTVWIRTGQLPAAGAGDEVWFSESGYYFLKEGTLRRPMLADGMGSAYRDLYCPWVGLGQALSFSVFGVNQFGMMAMSSVIFTVVLMLVYKIVRRLSDPSTALLATIGFIAPMIIERNLLRIRPELYTPLFFLLFLQIWWWSNEHTPGLVRTFVAILSGVMLGMACLAYYGHAPFVLFAGMVFIVPKARRDFPMFSAAFAGGCLVLFAFLVWIHPDWELFKMQILGLGKSYYFNQAGICNTMQTILTERSLLRQWANAEVVIALVFTVLTTIIAFRHGRTRAKLGMAAFCLLTPFLYYGTPFTLVIGGILSWLLIADLAVNSVSQWPKRVAQLILICGALLVVVKALGMIYVLVNEHYERQYGTVAQQLNAIVVKPGKVATGQRGWLALRPRLEENRLHFLVPPNSTQSFAGQSLILYDTMHYEEFDYFIIDSAYMDLVIENYPIVKQGISTGDFEKVAEINSKEHGAGGPYGIIVFARKMARK